MPPVLLPNLSPWEAGFPFPHENTKSWDKSSHAAQPLIICNKMRNELLIPSDEARKALRHPGSRLHAFRQARGEEGTCLFSARPQPRESGVCLSVCLCAPTPQFPAEVLAHCWDQETLVDGN